VISSNINFETGSYYNGNLTAGTFTLNFAPIPNIYLQGQYNRNHFKEVGEPATDKTVDLYSISARLALNPRLQLIGFYQKNSENNLSNYNFRLSWGTNRFHMFILYSIVAALIMRNKKDKQKIMRSLK
jgi:hypothetical protein